DSISGVSIAVDGSGNPISSMTNGSGPAESTDEIRLHASAAYAAHERAVTTEDYARIALTVPGVTVANAIAEVASTVVVYIAGPDRQLPSDELVTSVKDTLTTAGMAGITVTVDQPDLININFGTE